jgi:sodium-independent sulfate anion transporter 11
MASTSKAVKWGKKVIGHPEDPVPVVSSKDWLRGLVGNPKEDVSPHQHTSLEVCH